MAEQLARDQSRADEEWQRAPSEDALRHAHAVAGAARDMQNARMRLTEAEARQRAAEHALKVVRDQLAADAEDMRLPESPEAVSGIESALDRYRDMLGRLEQAGSELRLVMPDLHRARGREAEAREDLKNSEQRLGIVRAEWEDASARLEALRHAVGAEVEELKQQLTAAGAAVTTCEIRLGQARSALSGAGEARAVAGEKAVSAIEALRERGEARTAAVERWQQFVVTGLLPAAVPGIELPDTGTP
jgi:chromosome segregation ATPase